MLMYSNTDWMGNHVIYMNLKWFNHRVNGTSVKRAGVWGCFSYELGNVLKRRKENLFRRFKYAMT